MAKMMDEEKKQSQTDEDARTYIMSLFLTNNQEDSKPPQLPPKPSDICSASSVRKVTLQSIL